MKSILYYYLYFLIALVVVRLTTGHSGNYTIRVNPKLSKIAFIVVKKQRARPVGLFLFFLFVFWVVVGMTIFLINASFLEKYAYIFCRIVFVSLVLPPLGESIVIYRNADEFLRKKKISMIVFWSALLLCASVLMIFC